MYQYCLSMLLLVGIFLISPIMMDWWLSDNSTWYSPFVIWLLLILFYMWFTNKQKDPDDL